MTACGDWVVATGVVAGVVVADDGAFDDEALGAFVAGTDDAAAPDVADPWPELVLVLVLCSAIPAAMPAVPATERAPMTSVLIRMRLTARSRLSRASSPLFGAW